MDVRDIPNIILNLDYLDDYDCQIYITALAKYSKDSKIDAENISKLIHHKAMDWQTFCRLLNWSDKNNFSISIYPFDVGILMEKEAINNVIPNETIELYKQSLNWNDEMTNRVYRHFSRKTFLPNENYVNLKMYSFMNEDLVVKCKNYDIDLEGDEGKLILSLYVINLMDEPATLMDYRSRIDDVIDEEICSSSLHKSIGSYRSIAFKHTIYFNINKILDYDVISYCYRLKATGTRRYTNTPLIKISIQDILYKRINDYPLNVCGYNTIESDNECEDQLDNLDENEWAWMDKIEPTLKELRKIKSKHLDDCNDEDLERLASIIEKKEYVLKQKITSSKDDELEHEISNYVTK